MIKAMTSGSSAKALTIAVDLMGSDAEPSSLIDAVWQAEQLLPSFISFKVIASKEVVKPLKSFAGTRIEGVVASEVIYPDDPPLVALRQKKDSSLLVGMRMLQNGHADALISAGQTGALFAASAMMLPLMPNVRRPALLAEMPTRKNPVTIVDVGGSLSTKALNFVQYAWLGSVYQRCRLNTTRPKVALLNVGLESQKGTKEQRDAFQVLQNHPSDLFEFVGNIEAREVFEGSIDVLVTDGFSGNVLLKASEGIASLIFEHLISSDNTMKERLKPLQQHFDYTNYPGALVCGVEKLVLKCHGNATAKTLGNALIAAAKLLEGGFLQTLQKEWSHLSSIMPTK